MLVSSMSCMSSVSCVPSVSCVSSVSSHCYSSSHLLSVLIRKKRGGQEAQSASSGSPFSIISMKWKLKAAVI